MTAVLEAPLNSGKANRRLVLARAAARLFRERGYDRTTAFDIAATGGCSRRTLFRDFESTADVVLLDAEIILCNLRTHLRSIAPGVTRWQQVRTGLRAVIRSLTEPPRGWRGLAIARWLEEPAVARRFSLVVTRIPREIAMTLCGDTSTDPDQDLAVQMRSGGAMAAYLAAARLHTAAGANIGDLFEESISMLDQLLADGRTGEGADRTLGAAVSRMTSFTYEMRKS